nr:MULTISPECIES: hypothetical protein [unclassified Rhodococcus (in: high G+C Gram-positive bacteria)]
MDVLAEARHDRPDDPLVACYLALALTSAGKAVPAVALLLETAVNHMADEPLQNGRWALTNYAQALRYGYWSPEPGTQATSAAASRAPSNDR